MGPHGMGWARSDQRETEGNDNRNGVKAVATERSGRKMERAKRTGRASKGVRKRVCEGSHREKDCARAHKVEKESARGRTEKRVVSGTQERWLCLGHKVGNLMSFGHAFQEKKVPAFFL